MRKILASIALVGTLALTACGGAEETVSSPSESTDANPVSAPTATPIPKSTPTQDSKKSPRGNLIGNVGDVATLSDSVTKEEQVKFTINAITPGACDQPYSRPAENGQILFVDVTVETTPALANDSFAKFMMNSHDFKFIDNNGTTFNGSLGTVATYSCIADAATLPGDIGPAEKVAGRIVLDVPAPTGILVFEQGFSGGFEYKF